MWRGRGALMVLLVAWGGCSSTEPTLLQADMQEDWQGGEVRTMPDGQETPDRVVLPDWWPGPETEVLDFGPGPDGSLDGQGTDGWGFTPCADNGDCDSGFCVDGPDGKVCAIPCVEECPAGWLCQQAQSEPDLVFVCVYPHVRLCWPCLEDDDCNTATAPVDNYCLSQGAEGAFCGSACQEDINCPPGYLCQEVAVGEGGTVQQCVSAEPCTCTAKAVAAGATTACEVSNELGTCTGFRVCTEEGLSQCDAPPAAPESCDGVDNDCDGEVDEADAEGCTDYLVDADKDGFGGEVGGCYCTAPQDLVAVGGDCDDANPAAFPGASEICNGADTDCDGEVDEPGSFGCLTLYADADEDGYGSQQSDCVCAGTAGYVGSSGDCDDGDADQHPNATEFCNGEDDDCDGQVDEDGADCIAHFIDEDGDGVGDASQSKCLCGPEAPYIVTLSGDCNDLDPEVAQGGQEVCDGKDNDCDGLVDEGDAEGCQSFFVDADLDGFGGPETACLCQLTAGHAQVGGDCDDSAPGIHPDAAEVCNGKDDNCDGTTDPEDAAGCQPYYEDADGDEVGSLLSPPRCLCAPDDTYSSVINSDCNDGDPAIWPGAQEICDGQDNNCDGLTDPADAEGCVEYLKDEDGDGFASVDGLCLCAPELPYTIVGVALDCDDKNAAVNPDAEESCNGIDDDCDGQTDPEGMAGCEDYYKDADGDDHGSQAEGPKCLCGPMGKYTAGAANDCNDEDAAIFEGAPEVCDGKDNDCDGLTDPEGTSGCQLYYPDLDGDGYGDATSGGTCLCAPNGQFTVSNNDDCNDANGAIHPAAAELCDGQDNNCDGLTDPENTQGCTTWNYDGDSDGFGSSNTKCLCQPTGSYTASQGGDCNDGDNEVHPAHQEVCDGKDNNCDNQIDPEGTSGCQLFFPDNDGDGHGSNSGAPKCYCTATGVYSVKSSDDCNDSDGTVYPGHAEVCDGKDNNCDFQVDPVGSQGCTTYYKDGDNDSYGDQSSPSQCLCQAGGLWKVTNNQDCNDSNSQVKPGAQEVCDGQDNNCDGLTDPENSSGCSLWYYDSDSDGWGTSSSKCLCGAGQNYTATKSGDCNDGDSAIYPNHAEACDGKDNDCNGKLDDNGSCYLTMYRFMWSGPGQNDDHYYKTNSSTPAGYSYEGPKFKIFTQLVGGGLVDANLYRLYDPANVDHLLTTSGQEVQELSAEGWVFEGSVGYCAPFQLHNSMVPLYRLWSIVHKDHFYTTSAAERDAAVNSYGYAYEGTACWVWPTNWP